MPHRLLPSPAALLASALLALVPLASPAQSTTSAPTAAAADGAAHRDAERVVTILHGEHPDAAMGLTGPTATAMGNATPLEARLRQVAIEQARRLVPSDTLRVLLVRTYEQMYTGAELQSLVTFLESPFGQRFVQQQREVGVAVAAVLAKTFRAHQAEFTQAMMESISGSP